MSDRIPCRAWRSLVPLALALTACGARFALDDRSPDAGLAKGECAESPAPPADTCGPLAFQVSTEASCSIALSAGASADAEGFIAAEVCHPCTLQEACDPTEHRACNRMFLMNRFGAGHIIAWCDATTLVTLLGRFDAAGYLGRTTSPRVASVGTMWPCPPLSSDIPGATHLGATLPDLYASDPEALAASFDVLIVCGSPGEGGGPWQSTLLSFVRDLGKGLLISEDYMLSCEPMGPDLLAVNEMTKEAGFVFEPIELTWAPLAVDLACVADYPP